MRLPADTLAFWLLLWGLAALGGVSRPVPGPYRFDDRIGCRLGLVIRTQCLELTDAGLGGNAALTDAVKKTAAECGVPESREVIVRVGRDRIWSNDACVASTLSGPWEPGIIVRVFPDGSPREL